jgi:hypothetical protein
MLLHLKISMLSLAVNPMKKFIISGQQKADFQF